MKEWKNTITTNEGGERSKQRKKEKEKLKERKKQKWKSYRLEERK